MIEPVRLPADDMAADAMAEKFGQSYNCGTNGECDWFRHNCAGKLMDTPEVGEIFPAAGRRGRKTLLPT